jgi:magnesium transporter
MANLNMTIHYPATNFLVTPPKGNDASVLGFPKNTAGNLMRTVFPEIRPNLAVAEAIKILHRMSGKRHQNVGRIFYIYVTDEDNHLLGVFSLDNLISACPGVLVSDFMKKNIITVKPEDDQATVAQIIAQHDLLAVPVVDDQNHILGIVTADDALDKIIPLDWKNRLPRFYR